MRFVWIVVTAALLWAITPASVAQSKKSTVKKSTQSKPKSSQATGKSKGKTSAKKTAPKKTTSATTRRRTRTRRATWRATQQQPAPERYTEIQQALAAKGYFAGEPDGKWGDNSVDALKRFQEDNKLKPDGKLSSLSLIALGLGPKHPAVGELALPSNESGASSAPASAEPKDQP